MELATFQTHSAGSKFQKCQTLSTFSNSVWNQISGLWDGTNVSLFVNGRKECEAAPDSVTFTPSTNLTLGATSTTTNNWNGSVADLKIYGTSDGSSVGTTTIVKSDFDATADRYRQNPVGNIVTSGLVLNLDAASAKDGIRPFANGCASTDLNWFDLSTSNLMGILTSFSGCGASLGWLGTGTTADPYKISISTIGTPAYISVNPPITLGASYSIDTWFLYPQPAQPASYNTLTRGGANDHQVIVRRSDLQLGAYDNAGGTLFRGSGYFMSSLSAGWHHLAAVASAGTTTYYIDGTSVGSIPWASTANILSVGNYWGGAQPWGDFAAFHVYNTNLSSSQVSQNCKAQQARFAGVVCN